MKKVNRRIEVKKTLFWLNFTMFIQMLLLVFVITINVNHFFYEVI